MDLGQKKINVKYALNFRIQAQSCIGHQVQPQVLEDQVAECLLQYYFLLSWNL